MRRSRKKRELSLDIAPINLIDLLLVLLVFFVTTTSFLQLKVIELDLPSASHSKAAYQKKHTHVINIKKDGSYYLDAKLSDLTSLRTQLKEIAEKDPKALFQVGADQQSAHRYFVKVLDLFQSLGIENIAILTKEQ